MNEHSRLNTPEHEAYRAQMLAYGRQGDDPQALRAQIQRLEAELLDMERAYLEADGAAFECERRHGGAA